MLENLQQNLFTEEQDEKESLFYREDSRASLTALQESARRLVMNVTYGQSIGESLARLNQNGYWLKMFGDYLQVRMDGSFEEFLETCPTWGMLSAGVLTEQMQLAHNIRGKGCSLWATPNTMDMLPTRSVDSILKMQAKARKGRSRPSNLMEQVDPAVMRYWRTTDANCDRGPSSAKRMQMKLEKAMPISINDQVAHPALWPTPTASDAWVGNLTSTQQKDGSKHSLDLSSAVRRTWLTPVASDGIRANFSPETLKKGKELSNLLSQMAHETTVGQLNPDWVEALMGFPPNWTETDK